MRLQTRKQAYGKLVGRINEYLYKENQATIEKAVAKANRVLGQSKISVPYDFIELDSKGCCDSIGIEYSKDKYIEIFLPNCNKYSKGVGDHEDFTTYAVKTQEMDSNAPEFWSPDFETWEQTIRYTITKLRIELSKL